MPLKFVKNYFMTHAFQKEGRYYLFDTESGSLHKVDKLVFDIEVGNDLSKYPPKDVEEARQTLKP